MKCPYCNASILDNSSFCPKCGKNLPRSARDNTSTEAHPEKNTNSGYDSVDTTGSNQSNQNGSGSETYINNANNSSEKFFTAPGNTGYGNPRNGEGNQYRQSGFLNNDPQLAEALKGIKTMNIMQIVCLVLMLIGFIPVFYFISMIMLLIILCMSFSLTTKVRDVFKKYNLPVYAKIANGIKFKCGFILLSNILCFIALIAMFIGGINHGSNSSLMIVTSVALLSISLVSFFFMIYCFFRLYTVKGALENITYGLPVVEKQNTAVIIGVVCAVILLLIVLAGIIVAAIALPAYSAYMKKAKFTEVVQEAETVKINMAGCVREHADDDVSKYCINTSGAASGNGWKLQAPNNYSTKYVESIVVSSSDKSGIPEFTITINANPSQFGGNVNMILVSQYKDNSLNWRVSPESSCIDKRLCGSRRY